MTEDSEPLDIGLPDPLEAQIRPGMKTDAHDEESSAKELSASIVNSLVSNGRKEGRAAMADGNTEEVKGTAAKAIVAEGLRKKILAGEMSPGQRLVEAELVEMFNVRRGSVRAAMDDLAAEGLIERIPNRGARVRVVSLDEAVAILECRSVLEGLIAARAAENVSGDQELELDQIGRDMQKAVGEGELMTYSQLNARLHALVAEISGQRTASELIVRLRSQIVRHQFQLSMRPGRPQVSLGQHLAIIAGVVAKDPAKAEAAARAHVNSVIEALVTGGTGT